MTRIYNKPIVKKRRRLLRRNMTKAEVLLWLQLKNKKILGQRFLRQFSVGTHILDFYCPHVKVAVEVDGITHSTKKEIARDKQRQEKIESLGIKFLRFTNVEIYHNMYYVLKQINHTIKKLLI